MGLACGKAMALLDDGMAQLERKAHDTAGTAKTDLLQLRTDLESGLEATSRVAQSAMDAITALEDRLGQNKHAVNLGLCKWEYAFGPRRQASTAG